MDFALEECFLYWLQVWFAHTAAVMAKCWGQK